MRNDVRVKVASRPVRCATCHDDLGPLAVICLRCGTALHPDCSALLGVCPTIGCVAAKVHEAKGPSGVRLRARPWTRRRRWVWLVGALAAFTVFGEAWSYLIHRGDGTAFYSNRLTMINEFDTALQLYYNDNHAYPTTAQGLEALRTPPVPMPPNWKPYVSKDIPKDPWGNPYRYRCPGTHDPEGFDIWSTGPDGIDGTADDVCGWKGPPR